MPTAARMHLLGPLFAPAEIRDVFSDRMQVQRMLDFEAALARAEARVGVIPAAAAASIETRCRSELFDFDALAEGTAAAGNVAIPLVKQLTALVGATDAEAMKFVHWGATSQDAIDTGLVLQLRDALGLIEIDLLRLEDGLARLADLNRLTPIVGRTWMQQALPTTFGLKAAAWLDATIRHRARLAELRSRVLVLQFGGAAGTLASLGASGLDVSIALAADLRLVLPALPWHTERDRVAEVATTLGLLVGTLGKIARDVSLLTQTEVAEAFEPQAEGRGGSSTMPHKRNPVGCAVVLAAAIRVPALVSSMLSAMVQEHERGLGNWAAEWETLPEIVILAAGALRQTVDVIEGLSVDAAQMRRNLDLTGGLILAEAVTMALGAHMGRLAAHNLVEQACRRALEQHRHLREVLNDDPQVSQHLGAGDLDRLLDPANYVGLADVYVDRALRARSAANFPQATTEETHAVR